ncbi:MAG: hypothetical protein IIA67_11120 [Planctomycetes bacterium]|nr:hypothetical protein [Planctomycetota bacterium]
MVVGLFIVGACSLAAAEENAEEDKAAADRAALEKKFEQTLSGATFVGHFTLTGKENAKSRKKERYTISSVRKIKDDLWLFTVRVTYGTRDVTVPIPLQVKWAGDTPIITLTDLKIPLLGTYTARVIIYRDKYAGTWSAGDHGGHLFGTIERPKVEKKKAK